MGSEMCIRDRPGTTEKVGAGGVQTREKEFLSIILLPAAALFYQVGRDSCPHITRTSAQPAVLLFAASVLLMTVLPGFIISEDP